MSPAPAYETEIKLRIRNLTALCSKLRALRARLLHRVHESNTLFDTPHHRLRKTGQLLRLRIESRPGSRRLPIRAVLTHKRPAPHLHSQQRYKVRKELEVSVGDPAALARIFAALGLQPAFRYEKYRSTYRLPRLGNLLIELDQTPIGVFLELEGSPRAIDRASRLLGFAPNDYLLSSYAALYFDFCRRSGIPPTDMLFSSPKSEKKLL